MSDENHWEDVSGDGGVLKSMLKAAPTLDCPDSFPEVGEEVQINYTGRLMSGVEFDTNLMFGSAYSKTFDIVIGAGTMIRGMDIALKTMRVGEKAQFRFREDYGYGEEGSPARGTSPAIPRRATICFEIELAGRSGAAVLSAAGAKKLAEDERRAGIIAIREELARQREKEKARKLEEKTSKQKGRVEESVPQEDVVVATVFDARWAKALKPNDLKQELKNRNLSTQGSKKDLLARLVADLTTKA